MNLGRLINPYSPFHQSDCELPPAAASQGPGPTHQAVWRPLPLAGRHAAGQFSVVSAFYQDVWLMQYRQLWARRALMLFKDVPLRARWTLSLYKVYHDSDGPSGSQQKIVEDS